MILTTPLHLTRKLRTNGAIRLSPPYIIGAKILSRGQLSISEAGRVTRSKFQAEG